MLCFVWLFWQWLIFLLDLCRFALICFTLRWFVLLALSPLLGFGFRLYSWLVLMCCVWLCFVYCFDLFHLRSFYCLCFVCFTEQVDLQVDLVGWLVVGWLVDLTGWLLIVFFLLFCLVGWLTGRLTGWLVVWLTCGVMIWCVSVMQLSCVSYVSVSCRALPCHTVTATVISVSCSCCALLCVTVSCVYHAVRYRVVSHDCCVVVFRVVCALTCRGLSCFAFLSYSCRDGHYRGLPCAAVDVSCFSLSCSWCAVLCRVLRCCVIRYCTLSCRVLPVPRRAVRCCVMQLPCHMSCVVLFCHVIKLLCRTLQLSMSDLFDFAPRPCFNFANNNNFFIIFEFFSII